MQTSLLKRLDGILTPAACFLAQLAPKLRRAHPGSTLIVRPGGMGDLICAHMALEAIGVNPLTCNWLIETRSRLWAEHRQLHYLCYDEKPLQALGKAFCSHERIVNTEQLFGLSQAYGIWARARGGKLFCFDTNRGAAAADDVVGYDWKDASELYEFGRLFVVAVRGEKVGFGNLERPRLHPVEGPPLVLIAGRQSPSRRISLETWVAQIEAWSSPQNFLIAAAPEDAGFADELTAQLGARASRFSGTFDQLCNQIARAEKFFTVDGGGVHIASYYGVPTRVIFTSGRDRKWAPLAAGSDVVRRHDLPCQPCTKFGQVPPCPNRYACLELEGVKPERL